jgi:hypothetical protein
MDIFRGIALYFFADVITIGALLAFSDIAPGCRTLCEDRANLPG